MPVRCRLVTLAALLCTLCRAGDAPRRVFSYHKADQARQLARDECKPLTLHFVPDNLHGGDQLVSFYTGPGRVRDEWLDKVVIIALPSQKYRRLARDLGIKDDGGYRTISPYDLSVFSSPAVSTIQSGFI